MATLVRTATERTSWRLRNLAVQPRERQSNRSARIHAPLRVGFYASESQPSRLLEPPVGNFFDVASSRTKGTSESQAHRD